MPANLDTKADGSASMFYVKSEGTPWHGAGEGVDGLLTAADALERAGLNWPVEKRPVYVEIDGKMHAVKDRYANVRVTDGKPLGIVGGDHKIYQNVEVFSFFDAVVDSGEAKYSTAGALYGGSRVWLTAKIGDTMTVAGEDHDIYLMIVNSHDGSRSLQAVTTFIRAVCSNTVTMGLNSAKTRWTLRHRTTLEGKAGEARDALQLAFKNAAAFEAEVERMMQISVEKDTFEEIVRGILPEQKRQKEKNVEQLMSVFENESTVVDTDAAGTAWGAFNALTFWLDWGREVRSKEARMTSLIEGQAARMRNQMHDRLVALGS